MGLEAESRLGPVQVRTSQSNQGQHIKATTSMKGLFGTPIPGFIAVSSELTGSNHPCEVFVYFLSFRCLLVWLLVCFFVCMFDCWLVCMFVCLFVRLLVLKGNLKRFFTIFIGLCIDFPNLRNRLRKFGEIDVCARYSAARTRCWAFKVSIIFVFGPQFYEF